MSAPIGHDSRAFTPVDTLCPVVPAPPVTRNPVGTGKCEIILPRRNPNRKRTARWHGNQHIA